MEFEKEFDNWWLINKHGLADFCPECGGDGLNHDPETSPLLCRSCLGSGQDDVVYLQRCGFHYDHESDGIADFC